MVRLHTESLYETFYYLFLFNLLCIIGEMSDLLKKFPLIKATILEPIVTYLKWRFFPNSSCQGVHKRASNDTGERYRNRSNYK